MKNILLTAGLVLASALGLQAQECATGYCPATITIHHKAGRVAPVTGDIKYDVITSAATGTTKCWITRNLGATTQAASATDATDASAGWYWQFNRAQGYAINTNGTPAVRTDDTRTPATTWITDISETSGWLPANDPCTLLLGTGWRLPTNTEWTSVVAAAAFGSGYAAAYSSPFKLHDAGLLDPPNGSLYDRGTGGYYWSSTQNGVSGYVLVMNSSAANTTNYPKAYGFSVRCLRDY